MPQKPLLVRIAEGDSGAVSECLDQFGGLVWSLAKRLTSSEVEAEDATQEIFVEIWKNASRYDPQIASEKTFVAMLARRRLIDRLRKSSRVREQAMDVDLETIVSSGDMEKDVEVSEEAGRALEQLQKLPREQSKVILLSVYHGMSHSRIAESMDLPLGTVKTHMRRGLKRLRTALGASQAAM